MAYMHPPFTTSQELDTQISGFNGADWERKVYRLLQDHLPPSWHVWWNKHQEANGFRHQYDFVVLVPGKGLVNLDAKGSGWTVVEGQTVCLHNGEVSIRKDIFDQAEKAQKTLWTVLEHIIGEQWGACSHLLVFRNGFSYPGKEDRYVADLENELRKDSKILERKIGFILEPFRGAFANFKTNEARVIRHLNAEPLSSEPDNTDDIRRFDDDSESGLSKQQRKVRSLLERNPNVHVVGAAGTGKTIVAIQLMRSALANGKKVLYICYNKALSEDLAARYCTMSDGERGVIVHFDAIPNRKIPGLGKLDAHNRQFRAPEDDTGWELRRRQIDAALEAQGKNVFDMLIVDEAQDLDNEHIFALFHLLKKNRKIIVFSDAKQSLFVKNWALDNSMFGETPPAELRLDENWRNTDVIHDRFRLFEEEPVYSMIFENSRPVETVDQIDSALEKVLLQGRRPCDIAVLCATRNQLDELPRSVSGIDGMTVKFTEDISTWRKGGRILKTTVRSFKGLEAPIVFFCEGELDDMSEDRYVGESRAKYELYIVSGKKMSTHGIPDSSVDSTTDVSKVRNDGLPLWDDMRWASDFSAASKARYAGDAAAGGTLRQLRIRVFMDTVSRVRAGGYDLADGTHVDLALSPNIGDGTRTYDSEIVFSGPAGGPDSKPADLSVVEGDCLETARALAANGKEVCVLNMASADGPGGGVHNGAGAQEEHLFRSSDYFRSLYRYNDHCAEYGIVRAKESPYPLHPRFGGIFTRGVTVFRGPEREGYPLLAKPWRCNFVAVPALNRGKGSSSRPLTPAEESIVRDKIATILRICRDNGQKTLVLSAFGCGAFGNPARRIAELFREALESDECRGAFDRVVFSVMEDHNSPGGGNLPPFRAVFG